MRARSCRSLLPPPLQRRFQVVYIFFDRNALPHDTGVEAAGCSPASVFLLLLQRHERAATPPTRLVPWVRYSEPNFSAHSRYRDSATLEDGRVFSRAAAISSVVISPSFTWVGSGDNGMGARAWRVVACACAAHMSGQEVGERCGRWVEVVRAGESVAPSQPRERDWVPTHGARPPRTTARQLKAAGGRRLASVASVAHLCVTCRINVSQIQLLHQAP